MILQTFYDRNRDIQETIPGLDICISEAFETGIVKDTGVSPFYNAQNEVSEIGSRVSDAFEAYDAAQTLKKSMSRVQPTPNTGAGTDPSKVASTE